MPTTDNGWPASPDLPLRPLVVNGVSFAPGIADNDDVETVLRYFVEQYVARIEPLVSPGCWGFAYRENRNSPNSLSRHSGGIAIDINAPQHPNGVATSQTFTAAEIDTIHQILADVDHTLRWGGDYTGTPDAMHIEINTDAATLHATAERLRGDTVTPEDRETIARRAAELVVAALSPKVERIDKNVDDLPRKLRIVGNAVDAEVDKKRPQK